MVWCEYRSVLILVCILLYFPFISGRRQCSHRVLVCQSLTVVCTSRYNVMSFCSNKKQSLSCNHVIPLATTMVKNLPSGPLPRIALAAALGFTAITFEFFRRRRRGPIREKPPSAEEVSHHVFFGKGHVAEDSPGSEEFMDPPVSREDPYFWLRDDSRKAPKVLEHLRAENAYTNFKTLPLRQFSRRIYKELLSHYIETDSTVPAVRGKYAYYTRTVAGKSYTYFCRRPLLSDGSLGDEDVLLDVNALAESLKYCDVSSCEVSPDDRLLAYSVDVSGYETYEIRFVDLATRALLEGRSITDTAGSFEWGTDSTSIFYQTMDDSHRPYKFWRRDMDVSKPLTVAAQDTCLYTEHDTEYYLHASKSRSDRFLFVSSHASMTSEERFIDLHANNPTLRLVREREAGVLYDVSHGKNDTLYIVTNTEGATNFKVMSANVSNPSKWENALDYDNERKIDAVTCFEKYAVVVGREDGFKQLWIAPQHDMSQMYQLPTDDVAHVVVVNLNLEYKSKNLRYSYSSLTTPKRIYELDMESRERTLLKEDKVPAYDASLYATERLEAVSKDGTRVPISLVYRKDMVLRGDVPSARRVLLYGYGSYEISMEPSFTMTRLPLLDRGVVYAIAHVRGGGEYGREWYEAARLETKKKTFEDFVACAQHLVDCGRTKPEWMAMEGRSAGGLLVGAVLNMRPDLFRAAIAGVPFVDVLNTMSDASIPLTTGEWQEWGNPHVEKFFKTISEYCPYSNIAPRDYPALLVLSGLYDPRVGYWECAKFVAKLRKHSTSGRDILLKTDLSSGHFSASNRYRFLEERAFELAWVVRELGLDDRSR